MAKRTVNVTMAVGVNIPLRFTVIVDPDYDNGDNCEVIAVEVPMSASVNQLEVMESMGMEDLLRLDELALKAARGK